MPTDNPSTPSSILKQAINAVPAVKYALGVGGIIAVIAIVRGFGIDFRVALWGTVVMLVLMTVLLVFAKASSRPQSAFKGPAFILTWFSLVLFMATATALFLSVFFGKPLDLRTLLAPVHAGQTPSEKLSEPPTPKVSEPPFDISQTVKKERDGSFHATAVNGGSDIEHVGMVFEYFVAERQGDGIKFYRLATFRPPIPDVPLKKNQAMNMSFFFTDNYIAAYQKIFAKNRASILGVKITMTFRVYGDTKELKQVWVYNALGQVSGQPPIALMISTVDKAGPPETQKDILTSSEVVPFIDADDRWEDYVYAFEMKKGVPIKLP